MRVAVFSTKSHDRRFLSEANSSGHELVFFEVHLGPHTVQLARGFDAVCPFVNDALDRAVLQSLHEGGTRLVALRSAGFNHVDLRSAAEFGLVVSRVPAYSPYAVAEQTLALLMALNRKIHRAYWRVREGNFSLDGLLGFDVHGKTVGIIGLGKIGQIFAGIMHGMGCTVLGHDPSPSEEARRVVELVPLQELYDRSHVVSLHCPLTPQTHHMIDAAALARMRRGAMLINTSRGALVDTRAVITALKTGQLGALGLDVYEEEADLFFEDLSSTVIQDDVFMRLLTFPNVLITGHQGFFTAEALENIAGTTLANVTAFEQGTPRNVVTPDSIA